MALIPNIGKYSIQAELGRGGFSRVYRAWDPDMRRLVAIKLVSETDPEVVRRFELEIDTTAKLQHPNIVVLYGRGEEGGFPYVVMELLEGMTLEQIIHENTSLPLRVKVRIMNEVASGLAYAHSRGVIHRDVKPGNIVLRPDGSVKIMDFGIARMLSQRVTQSTRAGIFLGTIPYMAPEQIASNAPADPQTDIFSFGATYYELLTGHHPFAIDNDVYATISRVQSIEPEPVSHFVTDCPEALEQLVLRALARDRSVRYPHMSDVLLDNEAVMGDLGRETAAAILAEVQPVLDAGDLERAEARLREAAELDPANREIRQLRNKVRQEATRRAAAQRVGELLGRGERLMQWGRFGQAVKVLESAAALDKDGAAVKTALEAARTAQRVNMQANRLVAEGRRNQQHGYLEEGLALMRRALELVPDHRIAKILAAQIEREFESGEQLLRDAMAAALRLMSAHRFEEAMTAIARAEARRPRDRRLAQARTLIEQKQAEYEGEQRRREDEQRFASGLQALVDGARERIRERRYGEAVELIEAAPEYEGEGEIKALLATARAARALDDEDRMVTAALIRVGELERGESLDAALDALKPVIEAYPRNRVLAQVSRRLSAAIAMREAKAALGGESTYTMVPAPETVSIERSAAAPPAAEPPTVDEKPQVPTQPAPPPVNEPKPALKPEVAAPTVKPSNVNVVPAPAVTGRPGWTVRHTLVAAGVGIVLLAAAVLMLSNKSRSVHPAPSTTEAASNSVPVVAPTPTATEAKPAVPPPLVAPAAEAAPQLTISPAALSFDYHTGQPAPQQRRVEIHGPSEWSFTPGDSWLAGRARSAGGHSWLDVSVHPDGLAAGQHSGIISISSGRQERLLTVQLNIAAPGPPAVFGAAVPRPTAAPTTTPAPTSAAEPSVDCHGAEYMSRGLPEGDIIWNSGQPLNPGATLIIGCHQRVLAGPDGRVRGTALPGCEVAVTSTTPGVVVETATAVQAVRVKNAAGSPLSSVRLHWSVR
ncbi:MAG TPA: protein kinase [Bryobacteraceae bacterium]|nr:protein kinase [Bryobacteraceae bacterium]